MESTKAQKKVHSRAAMMVDLMASWMAVSSDVPGVDTRAYWKVDWMAAKLGLMSEVR